MAKKKKLLPVEITLVVDRSGSMGSICKEVIGGINAFYEEQKKQPGEAVVTFHQFDNVYETVFSKVPLTDVVNLNDTTYVPRGMTALNDAIGRTISSIPADTKAPQMIMIMTDGEENSSSEYKPEQVKTLVEDAKKKGWQVIFMGANIDAFAVGNQYGIDSKNIAQFTADKTGATAATMSVSSKMSSMRSSYVSGQTMDDWSNAGGDMSMIYATSLKN